MANLNEVSDWTAGIYQLEEEDPVQGGAGGIDNLQAQQLANRTAYLKALVEALASGKQPIDATLTALAGLVGAADKLAYFNGADTASLTTLTAFARTLLDDVDAAAARTTLGAAALASPALTGIPTAPTPATGTNTTQLATTAFVHALLAELADFQPSDPTLTALAGLVGAADKLAYFNGADTATLTTLTAFARTLLDDADAGAARTTLGAAALASPALTGAPTAPTPAPGTNTTQIANTEFVLASSIGFGQTWQNVTASRVFGTTYYNTTGKPIAVQVSIYVTGGGTQGQLFVDGSSVSYSNINSGSNVYSPHFAIVPPGSSYSATGGSLNRWVELR